MLIVIPLFGLFCLVIVLVRLNFAISHNESNEVRMRVQAIWDQIVENNLKRTSFYQKLEDALAAYKTNKDQKVYNEQKKKLESELKSVQQDLIALQAKIKVDSADSAEKVCILEKKIFGNHFFFFIRSPNYNDLMHNNVKFNKH
jgi:hypothetical protein